MVALILTARLDKVDTQKKILEFPDTKVIALDRDPKSKTIAIKFKKKFKDRFDFHNRKFSDLDKIRLPKKKME